MVPASRRSFAGTTAPPKLSIVKRDSFTLSAKFNRRSLTRNPAGTYVRPTVSDLSRRCWTSLSARLAVPLLERLALLEGAQVNVAKLLSLSLTIWSALRRTESVVSGFEYPAENFA